MHSRQSKRTTRRSRFVVVLTLLAVLQTATPVWAWGRLGHRLTARIAERHLTERAEAEIRALLEPGESLADASTWADEHRWEMPKTAPWHYVDVPLDQERYDARLSGDDPKRGCIVDKIRRFTPSIGRLSNGAESDMIRGHFRPLENRRPERTCA